MSTLHAVLYREVFDVPEPQPTSLWWRRKGMWPNPEGHDYVIEWDHKNPWHIRLEFYDRLAVQLPVDAFKMIEHEEILGDYRKDRLISLWRPKPWLDILAPFPPTITHWEPLTWTGQHKWPGLGKAGYDLNGGGYHSHVGCQSSP